VRLLADADGLTDGVEEAVILSTCNRVEVTADVASYHGGFLALKRLLTEQQTMFEAIWQRLTLMQRAVLRAVVFEEGRELLSADVRTRHRLGGPSSVQTALAALVREDLISRDGPRYAVVDSLLREWIARQTF